MIFMLRSTAWRATLGRGMGLRATSPGAANFGQTLNVLALWTPKILDHQLGEDRISDKTRRVLRMATRDGCAYCW